MKNSLFKVKIYSFFKETIFLTCKLIIESIFYLAFLWAREFAPESCVSGSAHDSPAAEEQEKTT